ncbi:MAG: mitochondrial fission ELM1 family protein, partial [Myxococcales bacterium]|nr:mitochondrial fission ELM1 family protein [Myxococcales bacterium]
GEAALLDLLDEALAAQLVSERRGDGAGSYDFTHALIRQTLYGELSTPRRVLLHRQIGEALEALYGENLESHLSELAHHFYQAAPGGDVDKALDYATRAGDHAVELLAHEEAASHYEVALQALDLKDKPDDRQRYDLLMALGQAYTQASMPEQSLVTLEQAVDLADTLGEPLLLGEAAFCYGRAVARSAQDLAGGSLQILELGLRAMGEDQSALRSDLLSNLSMALPVTEQDRKLELAREAKELGGSVLATTSRRTGDRASSALRDALSETPGEVYGPNDPGENPFLGYLAWADQLVITADSETLLAEATSLGKPVYIYPLPQRLSFRLLRFFRELVLNGAMAEPLGPRGTGRPQRGLQRLCGRLIEHGLVRPSRDLELLHQDLISRGVALHFGTAGVVPSGPPLHELEDVAERVRSMMGVR